MIIQHLYLYFCTGSVCYCSRGKGADETVKFGPNSCLPILAMKKLGVFLLASSIEYFDHLLVKNYARNGFEKSIFFSLSQLKSANIYKLMKQQFPVDRNSTHIHHLLTLGNSQFHQKSPAVLQAILSSDYSPITSKI